MENPRTALGYLPAQGRTLRGLAVALARQSARLEWAASADPVQRAGWGRAGPA
jgi:hypothetical protein